MYKLKKLKSAIISGAVALSALAAPFSSVAPSLTANAAGNDNYAKLLQYSLYFYDANMCGDQVGETSAMTWRDDCHTSDEVKGGFHDAGDHAMFGLPQGYSAATLGWSYYEFKDAYDSTGQTEHLKLITDYFCDFFKRSTKLNGNNVSGLLYQKGDGDEDHGYWGAPELQGGGRKMFWTSNSASDIAAEYAAALAVNYINFGNAEDLKYAEALYNYSVQTNSVATDGPTGFYNNSSCVDEQGWAAGWLYLATKNEKYKNDCASKQTQYLGWIHGWENVNLGSAILLAEITGDWSKVTGYIGSNATGSNYLCLDDWGSARLNCSMQLCALVATKHGAGNYSSWCQGQMDYLLGNNPFNTCFVTGFASNSAKNTHHRAASGYQGYNPPDGMNEFTTTYHPTKSHVLIGALTGGPNKNGQYSDVMNDYQCNEVAIDYNACLVGATAGLYSMYKTGSTDSNIEGVSKIYNGTGPNPGTNTGTTTGTTTSSNPGSSSTTTVTTQQPSTGGDIVLTPDDMTVGTEKGDDGEMNNYAEFKPQGAKSATLYYKINSNDMNTSGAFGTWNGEWVQEDFTDIKVPADKIVTVDYTIPANVGQTVKAMVFWPHGDAVTIEKVVLHKDGGSSATTNSTSRTTTGSTTSKTTTSVTQSSPSGGNGNDVVLTPDDMTVGTEKGDDGEMNNYAEFKPQGAKSATLYYKVNSNDMNTSGAFGTWNGEWVQEDFSDIKVPADKIVTVDYIIPANVGQTVKAMVFWPHGDAVTIEKVVLHMDGSSNTTTSRTTTSSTTSRTTTSSTTTTTTTTQPPQNGKLGDANCDGIVDISDAVMIMQAITNPNRYGKNGSEPTHITEQGWDNGDVQNRGNGLTIEDALTVQLYLLGTISSFSA